MEKKVRVRFAPSPTGPLHIGGVRTALYNYLFAKKHNGDFILRIEDTDRTRLVEGTEEYIIESLKWCGIIPNEGQGFGGEYAPYRQSERIHIYRDYVDMLIKNGNAYYAFDSAEDLDTIREKFKSEGKTFQYDYSTRMNLDNSLTISVNELNTRLEKGDNYVIRIKLPENEEIKFYDQIRGLVIFNTNNMDDKVLYKSDGLPTYHLANVVDDYTMKISHVIRGEEWLSSAPLHVMLYRYLNIVEYMPHFAHLPLILKPDGKGKLSKRDGDRLGFPVFPLLWVNPESKELSMGYRENGYLPNAFINMLALLGWNPGTEKEIYTIEELIEDFTIEKVGKSGSKFDPIKAKWFNQQHLKLKSTSDIAVFLQTNNPDINLEIEYLTKMCELMKERVFFANEILDAKYLYKNPQTFDKNTVDKKWNDTAKSYISDLENIYANTDDYSVSNTEKLFDDYLLSKNLKIGQVLPIFRLIITGASSGPSMFEICNLIGKKELIFRLQNNVNIINTY